MESVVRTSPRGDGVSGDQRLTSRGRICLFMPTFAGGGAERVMLNLAEGMVERGENVDLVVISADGPNKAAVPAGVRLIELGSMRARWSVPALTQYLRKERPVGIISALHHANIVAILAQRRSHLPIRTVITVHNTHRSENTMMERMMPIYAFACYRFADDIVAVSHGTARSIARRAGLRRDRVRIIYNPVIGSRQCRMMKERVDHPWLKPEGPPVIVTACRLTKRKDLGTLLRAVALVRRKHDARLIVLGDGPALGLYKQVAYDVGVSDYTAWPGFVHNALSWMAQSQVFVLSSTWEALPTVLIEALAAGVPVVSTDCRYGPREILGDGKYGFLVAVHDEYAMAHAINEVLEGRGIRPTPEVVKPYRVDTAVQGYLDLILTGERR